MFLSRTVPPAYSPAPLRAVLAPTGESTAELRELISRTYDAAAVLLTDSGTSALTLAIRVALAQAGNQPCLLPAFGCYDLATAALGAGAKVVLYDVDPHTFGPDMESLQRGLRGGASCVVAAHLFGIPVDLQALRHLLPPGTLLIEDAAQGLGGTLGGAPLGSHGDFAVLSFGRGKGWTGGGGGALLAKAALPEHVLREGAATSRIGDLKILAAVLAQEILSAPSLYAVPAQLPFLHLGETRFKPPHPPRVMPGVSARIALSVRDAALAEQKQRKYLASQLAAAFAPSSMAPVRLPENAESGWLRYPFVSPVEHRGAPELGIVRSYPRPLSELAELKPALIWREKVPGAALLASRLLTLPTHSRVRAIDFKRITDWIRAQA